MTNLKNNIDHYMRLKGIKKYSDLLINIAHILKIKGDEAYQFANKQKSNFSKMLNGERPLKYEFIIPLERIFGVSLARLLEENAFKLPIEKDNIPFNKGFRYYAYLDDPKLYKEEFDLLLTKNGESIITQTDEFGKTFLDYIVEYQATNGVRYLYDTYGITLKYHYNQFDFNKNKGVTWINFDNSIDFARLVASMNDAELFNDIYDTYNMFFLCGHYGDKSISIFYQDEFLENYLENDNLFNSLFVSKEYIHTLGNSAKRKLKVDSITYNSINPIINNCLRCALEHLDKYKQQAIKILKFGIEYNKKISSNIELWDYIMYEDLGRLGSLKNKDYCELVIFTNIKTNDEMVNELIDKLPKFNTHGNIIHPIGENSNVFD